MVIRRRDLDLKSHPKDWRSPGSNSEVMEDYNTNNECINSPQEETNDDQFWHSISVCRISETTLETRIRLLSEDPKKFF